VTEPAVVRDAPCERVDLGRGSWVDIRKGWLAGADELFGELAEKVAWQGSRLWRYDHWVEEPRLGSAFRPARYPHPVLLEAHRALQAEYRVTFDGLALAYYRDGRDGQAFHRDRDMRFCEDTIIGILTLGARRPWLLRPRHRKDKWIAEGNGTTHDFAPASGDLLVMGGRCQVDWEHSVAKCDKPDAARISVQWRWTSGRGRPEVGASYRAPRHFDRT
jgi:alkylated DNA repair dioxygenase AlkB